MTMIIWSPTCKACREFNDLARKQEIEIKQLKQRLIMLRSELQQNIEDFKEALEFDDIQTIKLEK